MGFNSVFEGLKTALDGGLIKTASKFQLVVNNELGGDLEECGVS